MRPIIDLTIEDLNALADDAFGRPIPKDVSCTILRSTVGPSHDPYERIRYRVVREDFARVDLTVCALSGTTLMFNGNVVVAAGIDDMSDTALAEFWFETLTDLRPYDLEAAEARRWLDAEDIRYAELMAGWDASP